MGLLSINVLPNRYPMGTPLSLPGRPPSVTSLGGARRSAHGAATTLVKQIMTTNYHITAIGSTHILSLDPNIPSTIDHKTIYTIPAAIVNAYFHLINNLHHLHLGQDC